MAYKSLDTTFTYSTLNKDGKVSKNIVSVIKDGQELTKEDLAEQFLMISKNFKYPLKYNVLDAVDKGEIVMLYSPPGVKLPISLPFFLTKMHGKVVACIAVDLFANKSKKTDVINIEAKKLYTLLEAAYFARLCYFNSKQISTRSVVISKGASIYSNILVRVFNRKYALNIDKNKMNKMLYLASKFYMINLLGMKNDTMVNNYALKSCREVNLLAIEELDRIFPDNAYTDISTFITALKDEKLGFSFKDLQVRGFLESYLQMYESSMLLALESFPYFLYNVIAVTTGAYINNQYILEDIIGDNGAKIYSDLVNIR